MAFDAAARRGRVLRDPGWNKRVQAITEVALEAAEKLGPILTDEAPVWRARGWPGNTIRTYQTLQETWVDAATKLLPYIDLDLQASNYDATAGSLHKGSIVQELEAIIGKRHAGSFLPSTATGTRFRARMLK